MTMPQDDHGRGATPGEAPADRPTFGRASIYHFLELALAHPDEDGLAWIAAPSTEAALAIALDELPRAEALVEARAAAAAFFAKLRETAPDLVEADHIALFSANFPTVPCPPYGSLFTAEEAKRLEEMTAIKAFYRDSGFDVVGSFDDLPDHLCVELELLQALAHRAETAVDEREVAWARARAATFIDRFLAPFVERLAAIAEVAEPDNAYTRLLIATRHIVAHHRAELAVDAAPAPENKGHLA